MFNNVLFFNICITSITQVVIILCLIKMKTMMPFVSAISIMILVGMAIINVFSFRTMLKTRENSLNCTRPCLRRDIHVKKIDKTFFTSCAPLELWVGRFFTISSKCFALELYCLLLIQIVIQLLITFK